MYHVQIICVTISTFLSEDIWLYPVYINTTHVSAMVSWSWSDGSRIYHYMCNQCLSPLMLWVRISIRARYTTLCIIYLCLFCLLFFFLYLHSACKIV